MTEPKPKQPKNDDERRDPGPPPAKKRAPDPPIQPPDPDPTKRDPHIEHLDAVVVRHDGPRTFELPGNRATPVCCYLDIGRDADGGPALGGEEHLVVVFRRAGPGTQQVEVEGVEQSPAIANRAGKVLVGAVPGNGGPVYVFATVR